MEKEDLILLQQKVTKLRAEGKYKDTIENCYILLDAGRIFKDYKSVLISYLNLAASYYCIGDIELAFSSIEAYEEICDKYGDEIDKLNYFNVLFLLYEYNKNIAKAKEVLEKSIALGRKLKKYNIVSNGYSNYSHLCICEKNYYRALEMAKVGLEMARKHEPNTPILEFRVKLNLAKAFIGLNDFETSHALINEMINAPILESFIREKTEVYDLKGHWYSKQNMYKEAFEAFTYAKTLVENYNDVNLLKGIQEERCKLCELMGDFNQGFIVQKEYITLLKEISERELATIALKLEIKSSISSIEKKANIDYLTGAYNRNYLETTTNTWLKLACEKNESIACIVFDIDNFKTINDEYGHLFGDEVLRKVSIACTNVIRESDLFGRYGGDEFVIMLQGASLEDGKMKAEQILDIVRNIKIDWQGKAIPITISIGVTDNLSCTSSYFSEIFNFADMRLYKAKRKGRNQVCWAM